MRTFLSFCLLLISCTAVATTIDFDSQSVVTIDDPIFSIIENDFELSSTMVISAPSLIGQNPDLTANTSPWMAFCPGCVLTVEHTQGFEFDLESIDIAEIFGPDLTDVTFTGYLQGGETVQLVLPGDTFSGWDTYLFDSQWEQLVRLNVEMTTRGFGHIAVDNLVLANVVPIPAAAWLFGSALAGLGWMRRKQTSAI